MKFTKNAIRYARGFTLIELLVVIAIIGILSSIVLASLSTARSKGNDAKVQEQLNSVKSAMEIYNSANSSSYSSTGNAAINEDSVAASTGLSGIPFSDPDSGLNSLIGPGSTSAWPSGTSLSGNITQYGTNYAISASLSSGAWCVDSNGVSRKISADLASGVTVCPAS